jgi:hypothetical protein
VISASGARARAGRIAALGAAWVAAALAGTWPLVLRAGDSLPAEPRDPLLNAWILAWDADRAAHGFRGLWDAPLLYPYKLTLAFSEHLLGIAWISAPVQWLSDNPILAYNVAFVASYVLAGAGMYLLVRELTGRADAALVAALAFEWCPYRYAQLARIQMEFVGWMAVGLWATHRYARRGRGRDAAMATAAFCLLGLSNGYYLYFVLVPAVIVALWIVRHGAAPLPRLLAHGAVAAIVMGAVFGPIARVYVDARDRYDLKRDAADNSRFSADLGSYLHATPRIADYFPPARWLPQAVKPDGPLETKEGELFPGFVAIALAGVALWRSRPENSQPATPAGLRSLWTSIVPAAVAAYVVVAVVLGWSNLALTCALWLLLVRVFVPFPRTVTGIYGAVAIVALVLSLGPEPTAWGRMFWPAGPYAALFHAVPGLDGLRVPARMGMVVSLALCVLAGIGAATIFRDRPLAMRVAAIAVLAAIMFADTYGGGIPLAPIGRRGRLPDRVIYEWIAKQPKGAVLELPVGRMDYDYRAFRAAYATLVHGHPVVNGLTGYSTPLQIWLGGFASPLRDFTQFDNAIAFLRGLGVRYIIMRPDDFDDRRLAADLASTLATRTDAFREGEHWESVKAYELVAPQPPGRAVAAGGTPIPVASAEASHGADSLASAFDGRVDTRWTTAAAQSGDEWLRVRFAASGTTSHAVFRVNAGELGDYPRGLVVDAERAGAVVSVSTASYMDAFGTAVAHAPDDIRVRLPLASAVEADALRFRQTGRSAGPWWWSIDELIIER